MNTKSLIAAMLALSAAASASALTVANLGEYTLTYDETTVLGGYSSSFSSSGNQFGFTWNLPSAINVVSLGTATASFTLPSFTITVNPGYTLSGPVTSFLGNLVYTEVGGAVTSATASANVSVNGGPIDSVGGSLTKFQEISGAGYSSGYYAGTSDTAPYTFTSLEVSDFVLTLSATGGAYGSIVAQPQNLLKFTFMATPVPEPEAFAMMLAGLGLIAGIAVRRKKAAA